MKKIGLLFAGCLLSSVAAATPYLAPPGMAQPPGMGPGPAARQAPRAPQMSEAAAVLQEGMNKLMTFLKSSSTLDAASLQDFVDNQVASYFDFAYMAQWVAGPAWRQMNDQQKAAFQARLEQQFLGSMVQRLSQYNDQSVRFLPSRNTSAKEAVVRVALLNPRGYPARIEFRMYKSDSGWKVYDVVANGSSAMAFYRQHFRDLIYPRPRSFG